MNVLFYWYNSVAWCKSHVSVRIKRKEDNLLKLFEMALSFIYQISDMVLSTIFCQ